MEALPFQGEVKVEGKLDREEGDGTYSLTIEARDNNEAPEEEQRVTTGSMKVNLTDVNDSPPRLVFRAERGCWKWMGL